MPTSDSLLTVLATADPDSVYEFRAENDRVTFGRDATACDLVLAATGGDRSLSRVAGVLWRMEDELWLRNLSTRHELHIDVPGRPLDPPLPPRRDDGLDRGAARSIPAGLAYVRAPGGCELLVRQLSPVDPGAAAPGPSANAEETVRAPDLPAELRPVAVALCAPLLDGSRLPASYSQVAQRLGTTQKVVRTLVDKVCRLYADALPELRERIDARRAVESEQLGLSGTPTLVKGIWVFPPETPERRRVQALALPDYFEVAHLLVRRGIVTVADVQLEDLRRSDGPLSDPQGM